MSRAEFSVPTPDGANLAAMREGEGPPLLLVSGLGGTAAFWDDSVTLLARTFTVIRFDQRGIGRSTRGSASVTVEQLARDCVAVLDVANIPRCTLLGHSTGGCIGQSFAQQAANRLDGLILSATWLRASHYMTGLFGTRRAILEQNPQAYTATATLLAYPPEWLEENWHHYATAIARAPVSETARAIVRERIDALLAFDGTEMLASVRGVPTLVFGAADDMIVPAFLQRQLADALPQAALTMLDTGGHFFPISRTEAFCAAVTLWINEHATRDE